MLRILASLAVLIATPALANDSRTDPELMRDFVQFADVCRGESGEKAWRACDKAQVLTFILVDRGYCMEADASWVKGDHHKDDWACSWRVQ